MSSLETSRAVDVQVRSRGRVPRGADVYAREKVLAALDHVGEPVLDAQVKLTQAVSGSAARPAAARAVVDVNGRLVRAHVAASTMFEAVDLLRERLTARLARVRRHGPRGLPGTGREARWDSAGHDHRPHRQHLPVEERRIVRYKSFGQARQTPEDAVIDLEAMDYDFWVFVDLASGCDSVVYRDVPTGRHRLASLGPVTQEPEFEGLLGVSTVPVPAMTVPEAVQRLNLAGLPFVFFDDTATGRGSVLYHRYDGHYGLIAPAR
ncbi:HPF/RaiA family ribosome-associated protein [Streptomyces sp. R302]|uniref:sigma 54 modulation/S30EA ribosomal C-terminal domain-containing protein n=1 Tax=unclassified Streptomyces TaxID=2593676 RepID=UPI00145DE2D5|nr:MULTISPECIES: HPF/RaiA family ribosome-associated protein [unclassified Streptomyces]NML54123.1 HPF/RaiA family ribosome-associated protein [Streptomyces sp. R301]NML83383.1 HPF/RaiA family ribosome-associated protein [Streptomyces sp. R302]